MGSDFEYSVILCGVQSFVALQISKEAVSTPKV